MKFCIFILALVAYVAAETYTSENDHLDIEAVVKDLPTLGAFVDCFTESGPCTDVTSDFKKDMSEAIQQACAKCTDAQKHLFKVFLAGLKEKLPAKYEVYKKKYDADNKYFPALETAVANS